MGEHSIFQLRAGCAVTAGALVGLDVEETQRHTHGDPLRLACRHFSPKEIVSLEGRSLHGHTASFLTLHTQCCRWPTSCRSVKEYMV